MRVKTWWLFIDESGFGRDADTPVVAGVLVAQSERVGFASAVERALRAAAPEVPWPIHAWLTRRPVMFALWPASAGRVPSAWVGPVQDALAALEAHALEPLRRALDRLRSGGEPTGAELRALEDVLRARERHALGWLSARATEARAAIGRVLAGLATAGGPPWLFAAGETLPGDASRGGGNENDENDDTDAYLVLLECVFQRVAHALARSGGEHRVDLHALGRWVKERRLGRNVPLHPRKLAEVAAGATTAERVWHSPGAIVRLVPASVQAFDEGVHPGLVLADFVANAARPELRSFEPLAPLLRHLEEKIHLPATSGPERLSHTAASGAARVYLDARLQRPPPADHAAWPPGPCRPWAREQAIEWGRALETMV